jgi:hypothetical protein
MRQVRGAKYELSGLEMNLVTQYENQDPRTADSQAQCGYWTSRASEAGQSHQIGVLVWPAEYFTRLVAWAQAKSAEPCLAAARALEKGEPVDRAAEAAAVERNRERTRLQEAERGRREEEEEERRRAERAAVETETRTGRCTDDHVVHLRRALDKLSRTFDGATMDRLDVVGHQLVVATAGGVPVSLKASLRGDYHVFSFGYSKDDRLEVRDQQGYPVTAESPQIRLLQEYGYATGFETDSRTIRANSAETISVTIRGTGCVLVFALHKW